MLFKLKLRHTYAKLQRSLSQEVIVLGFLCLSVVLSGCANAIVKRDVPTIAHIHIGHAITAWPATPSNQGLLVVAELASIKAQTSADLLLKAARAGNLPQSKKHLKDVAIAVDPGFFDSENSNEYGLRRGTAEAMTHLKLASEVTDATANVQRTIAKTSVRASEILDRTDELTAYIDVGLKSNDIDSIEIIAEEIALVMRDIAGDTSNDSNYGLFELREDIEAMVKREDPPYKTVDEFYLFSLVKLPDGQWGFASRRSRGAAGAGY